METAEAGWPKARAMASVRSIKTAYSGQVAQT